MVPNEMLTDGSPDDPTLILAHGAGAPMDSDWMTDFAAALALRRLHVVRFEFPYMQRRRTTGKRGGPDRPAVLVDSWKRAVDSLGGGRRLVIGGKSMGGRIASMIADDVGARGLVCLGYPFHPPGKPERLRTAHLAELATPTLILQGTRDPFGTREEVEGYDLSAAIRLHWLQDGDHSFKPRVRSGRTLEQNLLEAADLTAAFVRQPA
jgi:predicted alpha/beta-hydrolase family hydrolase